MEQPEIRCRLKNGKRTYGEIVVKPNGTFSGEIEDPCVHALIVEMLRDGLADGLTLTFNAIPAVPLIEHRMEPIPSAVAERQLFVHSQMLDLQNPDCDGS